MKIYGALLTPLLLLASCGQDSAETTLDAVKSEVEVRGGTRIVLDVRRLDSHSLTESEQIQSRKAYLRGLDGWIDQDFDSVEYKVTAGKGNEIIFEIFGEVDLSYFREFLGSGAQIQVLHARNLSTTSSERKFSVDKVVTEDFSPTVWFQTTEGDQESIQPFTDEYSALIDDWDLIASQEDLVEALPLTRSDGSVVPQLILNQVGAKKMERWSRAVLNQSEHLAFVVDGVVLAVTPMKSGTILKDRVVIEGNFNKEQVQLLTDDLNTGWDVEISVVEEKVFPIPDVQHQ